MYTKRGQEAISKWESYLFKGDSDFRYDDGHAFYKAHAPSAPNETPKGRVYAIHFMFPTGEIGCFPPWFAPFLPTIIWEKDPVSGRQFGYEVKALTARTITAE